MKKGYVYFIFRDFDRVDLGWGLVRNFFFNVLEVILKFNWGMEVILIRSLRILMLVWRFLFIRNVILMEFLILFGFWYNIYIM